MNMASPRNSKKRSNSPRSVMPRSIISLTIFLRAAARHNTTYSARSRSRRVMRRASSKAAMRDLGFIFDLDGTIVDTMGYYREVWEELIQEFGADHDPDLYLTRPTRDNVRALMGEQL